MCSLLESERVHLKLLFVPIALILFIYLRRRSSSVHFKSIHQDDGILINYIGDSPFSINFAQDEESYYFQEKIYGGEGEWYGVDNKGKATLNAVFVDDAIAASVLTNEWMSSVTTLPNGTINIVKIVNKKPDEAVAPSPGRQLDTKDSEMDGEILLQNRIETQFDDGSVIDVLFVYTPEAMCAEANLTFPCHPTLASRAPIGRRCKLAQFETNVAFHLSQIPTRINIVHSDLVDDFFLEGNKTLKEIKYQLQSGQIGNVLLLRDKFCADLVILIVNEGDISGHGDVLGPFSVIRRAKMTGHFSVPHEIGHNLGCRHNREQYPNRSYEGNPYGYGYVDPKERFGTIMAFTKSRYQIFSNNNKTIKILGTNIEAKVGTEEINCAQMIKDNYVAISQFKMSQRCRNEN